MRIKSNAKINIGLNILEKRKDGYHNLDTIMVPISLYDDMNLKMSDKKGNLDLKINVDDIDLEENTLTKSYNLFFHKKESKKIKLEINKSIPLQAGLGGGSSNAAFFLKKLNEKYNYYSREELFEIARKVGADVPFFIENKPSRIQGIGDKIKQIDIKYNKKILLIKPEFGNSTKVAFDNYKKYENKIKKANIENLEKELKEKTEKITEKNIKNTLEQIMLFENEKLKKFKEKIEKENGIKLYMSGSGSCFYCLDYEKKHIEKKYKNKKIFIYEVKII